jgi:uncharacterized protein (DUF486 family)
MNDLTQSRWLPVVLLTCSKIFITFARTAKTACFGKIRVNEG